MKYVLNTIKEVFTSYFKGQGLVVLILCVLYAVGLKLIGIPFGILLGILIGLLSVIPYLGFTIGFIVTLVIAVVQSIYGIASGAVSFSLGAFSQIFWVILVFAVIQVLESFIITPQVMGKSIGINPIATMVLLIVGGMAFGPVGMIIAVPVAAVLLKFYKDKIGKTESENILN